jgi:hypothetical protein
MNYEVCFMNMSACSLTCLFVIHLAHLKARVFSEVFMGLKSIYSDKMLPYIHTYIYKI